MLRFAPLRPAAVVAGMVGVASVLGACGSAAHRTTSPPPTAIGKARRPPASTTVPVRRAKRPVPSTTAPVTTSTAPVVTSPPTTAPPVASTSPSTSTAAPSGTAAPSSTAAASTTAAPSTTVAPTSTATSAPSAPVRVLSDCQTPSYQPSTILLACGDGSSVATEIHWTSWGPTTATGTAVIKQDLCNPNCAQGGQGSFPASITLSQVVAAGTSGQLFSTLTATFAGASPTGTPTETYNIGAVS